MLELMTAPCELAGQISSILFGTDQCGSTGDGRPLFRYTCVSCKRQNPRGRDEWVSSSFPNEDSREGRDRTETAFKEVMKHVHDHEIIGEWAAKLLLPGNLQATPDRVDTLEPKQWSRVEGK